MDHILHSKVSDLSWTVFFWETFSGSTSPTLLILVKCPPIHTLTVPCKSTCWLLLPLISCTCPFPEPQLRPSIWHTNEQCLLSQPLTEAESLPFMILTPSWAPLLYKSSSSVLNTTRDFLLLSRFTHLGSVELWSEKNWFHVHWPSHSKKLVGRRLHVQSTGTPDPLVPDI